MFHPSPLKPNLTSGDWLFRICRATASFRFHSTVSLFLSGGRGGKIQPIPEIRPTIAQLSTSIQIRPQREVISGVREPPERTFGTLFSYREPEVLECYPHPNRRRPAIHSARLRSIGLMTTGCLWGKILLIIESVSNTPRPANSSFSDGELHFENLSKSSSRVPTSFSEYSNSSNFAAAFKSGIFSRRTEYLQRRTLAL